MDGLARDTEFVRELVEWSKLAPSTVAKKAKLTPSTILRPFNGAATTRISVPTIDKLKQAFPDFPGFAVEGALENVREDSSVQIERIPTHAGMGGGGTGDGDRGTVAFSRSLIETELRATPTDLLAIVAEGNSMTPDFLGGDLVLIDKRRRTLNPPGAFCLWEGDGYVVKYLERIHGAEPPRVRLVSRNNEIYPPTERLLEECDIQGRVVWFGRKVL